MNKKLISLLLAICLVIGLLPAMSIAATAAATSATIKLFGTSVTVDTDDTTADPAARYWADDGTNVPKISTAAAWNYSFTIIEGVPTLTLNNANYAYAGRFLELASSFAYDFEVVYKGENRVTVPNASSKQFIYYKTNSSSSKKLSLIGEDGAKLDVTGKYKDGTVIYIKHHPFIIRGGELTLTRSASNATSGVLSNEYGSLTVEDCTFTVSDYKTTGSNNSASPSVSVRGCTFKNSTVTIDSTHKIALCSGLYSGGSVTSVSDVTIDNSTVTVTENKHSSFDSNAYTGAIYAKNLVIKNGSAVEAKSTTKALTLTADLKLEEYNADYTMYTAEGGAAVTEYTATEYFKVVGPCRHTNTTTVEQVIDPGDCGNPGSKTVTVTCDDCGETVSSGTEDIPATGLHTYDDANDLECNVCGDVICLHTNTTETEVVTDPADCVNPGSKIVTETCDDCGDIINTSTVPIDATGVHEVARTEVEVLDPGSATVEGLKRVTEYCACGHLMGTREEPIPVPVVEMDSPAVDTTKPTIPDTLAASGTVTLWGTTVTVDTDDTTADPAARYWVNGAAGENPVASDANANWNYSLSIIDGIPTVTLRNAQYSGTESFLVATYDGCLKVAYEGTNDVVVPCNTTENTARYFINFSATTDSASRNRQIYIEGGDGAVLNITGGDDSASMISIGKKVYLNIYGGTINMEKAVNNGGVHSLIGAAYSRTLIQDCTLNVKNLSNTAGKHPAVTVGYDAYGLTVNNAHINIETNGYTGLCVGVFKTDMSDVLYPAAMTVNGNSKIKVITDSNASLNIAYSGVGIYAKSLAINGGSVEADAKTKAVHLTSSSGNAIPNLNDYSAQYKMFTAKYSAAVTEYTATPYFRIACVGESLNYKLTLQGTDYKLLTYDTPIYMINTTASGIYNITKKVEVIDPETGEPELKADGTVKTQTVVNVSHTKDYYTQTTEGATEQNYNAKLVWHEGDNGPTLYLRDFVIDEYDEELSKWRYSSATTTSALSNAGIHTGTKAPLKIVLEKGENVIKSYSGIHYQNELTIESIGDASLTLWTHVTGIVSSGKGTQYVGDDLLSGNKLTLNANLLVSQGSYNNLTHSGYIIRTKGADMVIDGGNIVTEYRGTAAQNVRGIAVEDSGNLIINGGYIYSKSYNTVNKNNAAVQVAGDIYVKGGTIDVETETQSGLKATNIYITGGTVRARVNYAPLLVSAETGVISFTGGLLDMQGEYPFRYYYTKLNESTQKMDHYHAVKEPTLGTGTLQGWVGTNPFAVEKFTGDFDKKYVKLGYSEVEQNVMPTPVPNGDIPLKTTIKISGTTYELKKYDADVIYFKNMAVDAVDKDGNPFTRYVQTTEGADESNWNAKFVWNSSDNAPTLYMRGFKLDHWNNDTEMYAWNTTSDKVYTIYAIETGSVVPMNIVLTGEDSLIESQYGIHYKNDLNIKSDGKTKLTINNQYSNISSINTSGYTLTVDANLDLYIRTLYGSTQSGGNLMNKGDIIVNGGVIICDNGVENGKDVNGIVARGDAGNLTINGGNITANTANAAGHRNGALQANGVLTINGGVLNLSAKKAVGMNGKLSVDINGGEINISSPWYGITAGYNYKDATTGKYVTVTAPVNINGGTLKILAQNAFYTGNQLTIGDGVMAYAGVNQNKAEVYDGTDTSLARKPWFFSTDDESKFLDIEEDDDDEDIIIAPTAPGATDGTGAPSDATGVIDPTGTTQPEGDSSEGDSSEDEIPEEEYWDSNIYIDYVEGDMDYIPDMLVELGLDTVDAIWEFLLDMMWNVDEDINRVSFFDAVPWFYNGEEWVFAEETDLPEDGYVTVTLPYPEGTDINTEFTGLHMFTTDYFGMTPGDVELLMPVNTEDGIELELIGLSPIMLGWTDTNDTVDDNYSTGDADVTIFFALMLFSVLGMATVVILNKKRAV